MSRIAALLLLLAAMPPGVPHAQLDHIVVAIRSLDEGVAQFEQLTGVRAGAGGKHPGRGTENALVSLGGSSYLEIIAPQAGATLAAGDERMRALSRLAVIDWAVSVPDVDAAVSALGSRGFQTSQPRPGARLTPAGERLDWMTFALADAGIAAAPFFIRWSPNSRHPSTTAPGGCALASLTVDDPQADRLDAMLKTLGISGVTVAPGATSVTAVLTCGSTRATLASR